MGRKYFGLGMGGVAGDKPDLAQGLRDASSGAACGTQALSLEL